MSARVGLQRGRLGAAGWAVVAVALVLRLPRGILRWDEVALAYAAYAAPTSEALAAGRVGDALASWVGLHPPLHALWMAVVDLIAPIPAVWLLGSILCSVGAVVLVTRHAGALAGLVLATAPLQLQDTAEVNNYPLATLGIAALVCSARSSWRVFLVGVALASWGHVLGLAAAGVTTAGRLLRPVHPQERTRVAMGALLLAAPVVAGVLRLSLESSTFAQPSLDVGAWFTMVRQASGPEIWVVTALALAGAWVRPGAAAMVWLGLALPYAVALYTGSAAPHQRPYLALLGPPTAVLVGSLSQWLADRRPRGWMLLAVAVAVVSMARAGRSVVQAKAPLQQVYLDLHQVRGVDVALDQSEAGDRLWLVAPALQADDDKSDFSTVLWRFVPWQPMPRAAIAGGGAYTDWLWGQPRWANHRVVHTSTELEPGRFDRAVSESHADNKRVVVVLYDHAPATGLLERTERVVRIHGPARHVVARDAGLGDDYVWVIAPPGAVRAEP